MYRMTAVFPAILFIGFFASSAHAFSRCCGPKQWTSAVAQVVGEYNIDADFYGLSEVDNRVYYDFPNKKIASVQTVTNETGDQPVITHIKQIMDYNLKKTWTIEGKNCTTTDLTEDIPSPCVPDFVMTVNLYQNVSAGPIDPTIFQIPAFCKKNSIHIQKKPLRVPTVPWLY